MSATKRTARKTTTRRATRRTTSRTTTRRRTPKLATTLGAALGAVVVSLVTDMSWGTRILILILVVVGAVGYLLWSHRAEIAAGQEAPPAQAAATDAPPTTPDREQP